MPLVINEFYRNLIIVIKFKCNISVLANSLLYLRLDLIIKHQITKLNL